MDKKTVDGVEFHDGVVPFGYPGSVSIECESMDQAMECWDLYANRWCPAGYGTTFNLRFERFKYFLKMKRYLHCD